MSLHKFQHDCLQQIICDHQSGATELARKALQALVDYSDLLKDQTRPEQRRALLEFARALQQSRPSMAPMYNLIAEFSVNLSHVTPDMTPHQQAHASVETLLARTTNARDAIAAHLAELVAPGAVVLAHSRSSTLIACFKVLSRKPVQAIITESRPGNEGRSLAKTLSDLGVISEYITEAQLGIFVPRADLILLGADCLLVDGSVINKAGSCLIAMAASEAHVPVYVCAESFKRCDWRSQDVRLEEMDGSELGLEPLPNIRPRNIYFDRTPARYVSAWIDEQGVQVNSQFT